MKLRPLRWIGAWLASLAVCLAESAPLVAITDVSVIPMDSERVLPGQTVIVRGDRIESVGPAAAARVPAGATVIDGRGKFLLPGLAEMHGHNPPLGSSPEYFEHVFFLFVANGVTTVRSMQGFPGQLEWREKARRGEIIAPTLYLAGPSFSGGGADPTRTPEQAVARVQAQKAEGWDLLKVHPGLSVATYDAMARTAREVGIEFSGHIPADVGLVHAIEQGQRTVDHLDGYIEALQGDRGPLDPVRLEALVKLSVARGVWVVPTMDLWESILGSAPADALTARPELKYLPRRVVQAWSDGYRKRTGAAGFDLAKAQLIAANRKVLLKAVADGGVRIIFGTDAPQIFSVPGFSIHHELRAMEAAGLGRFAILQSATRNVGAYYAAQDKAGLIAPGHRADLVLLNGNPLDDLGHVANRAGVMVRGRWLAEEEIQAKLAAIAANPAS